MEKNFHHQCRRELFVTNQKVLVRIKELESLYELRWGKSVDYLALPKGVSQENLCLVLERIVNTGESVIVGWSKLRSRSKECHYENDQRISKYGKASIRLPERREDRAEIPA